MAGKKHTVSRKPSERGTFHVVNFIIMCIIMLITVYPIWFAVINSLNYGDELVKGYSFSLAGPVYLGQLEYSPGRCGYLKCLVGYGFQNDNCDCWIYYHHILICLWIFQALSERKEILYGAWVYQYVFQRRNYSILRAV